MGKGVVAGGTNLWMGTAALSERDYVHEAIDKADLIISIGHDTVGEAVHHGAVRTQGHPHRLYAGECRAGLLPCRGDRRCRLLLEMLAERLDGKLPNAAALAPLRAGSCRGVHRATEERFPPTPQRIVNDAAVMPEDGIVCLDNEGARSGSPATIRSRAPTRCCWTTHLPRWGPACRPR